VIATCNLNGDYLSDACAAQVGGLGIAPGANIGTDCAIFEATHGTWPKGAGKNLANPSSLLLSGVMMLEFMGWKEAAQRIVTGLEKTIASKNVTVDLHTLMEGATLLSTSEFADVVIANMPEPVKVQAPAAAVAASAPADATGKDAPAQTVTAGSGAVEPASTAQVAPEAATSAPAAGKATAVTTNGGAAKTSDGSKPATKADAGAKDAK